MMMQPLKADQKWTTFILANLLESWSASRRRGVAPFPILFELAPKLGIPTALAAAFGSVFELAETCIGRPLNIERCCSTELMAPEQALIRMLQTGSAAEGLAAFGDASRELAEALATAATSASRLLAPPEHELDRLWHTVDAARLIH